MLTYKVWQSAAGERYFVSAQHGDGVFEPRFLSCKHQHQSYSEAAQCRDFGPLNHDEIQVVKGRPAPFEPLPNAPMPVRTDRDTLHI